MMKKLTGAMVIGICFFASVSEANNLTSYNINSVTQLLTAKAPTLTPAALKLGLQAYLKARAEGMDPQQILTIVDYSKPSTQPSLFVFDMKNNNLVLQTLVAHGKGSGGNVPTKFSDAPETHASSIGLYKTANTYIGHHGYSLRLDGLERGFNDMAASREIVVHAANYVSSQFARQHGRLGLSWGCFAVNPNVSSSLINTIKGGTLLFAYANDSKWISHSSFLN